jgi:exodeoxyribonuclease VII large subunit
LLISPTRVQGEGAEFEIVRALDAVARQPGVELVLLVRGGGSLEDLWAFNTEEVARAIERCPVPVVSGVGHETDFTIADLVADVRAPTPSAAAEQSLTDRVEVAARVEADGRRLVAAMRARVERSRARLRVQQAALRLLSPQARLVAQRRRLTVAASALGRIVALQNERRRGVLSRYAGQLDSLSPLAVLGRGYGLVTRARDGAIVRRAHEVEIGETVDVRLAHGGLVAQVEASQEEPT